MQSLDNSQREFMTNKESPTKRKTPSIKFSQIAQITEETITKQQTSHSIQQPQMQEQNQQFQFLQGIQLKGENSLHKRSFGRIILDSLISSLINLGYVYVVVFLIMTQFYGEFGVLFVYYLGLILFCFIVVFIFEVVNKSAIYKKIDAIDNQLIQVYHQESFVSTPWKNLCSGNLFILSHGQKCPCDAILLASSGLDSEILLLEEREVQRSILCPLVQCKFDTIEGSIKYDKKFISKKYSRIDLKLNGTSYSIDVTSNQKLKRNDINLSGQELLCLVSNNNKLYKHFDTDLYSSCQLNKNYQKQIQIQTIIVVFINVISIITITCVYYYQSVPSYMLFSQTIGQLIYDYLSVLIWGIPIAAQTMVYCMIVMTKFKCERDVLLDPNISGTKVTINNSFQIANVSKAEVVSVNMTQLSKHIQVINTVLVNKVSEEINLENPFQIVPIEEVTDKVLSNQLLSYPLLTLSFDRRNQDEIAIQKLCLQYGLFHNTKPNLRVIQEESLIQTKYHLLLEQIDFKGYMHIYRYMNVKKDTYILTYRAKLYNAKDFINEDIYSQISQSIEELGNVWTISRKSLTKEQAVKLVNMKRETGLIDAETIKQIKQDLEPVVFLENYEGIEDTFQALMDLHKAQLQIMIHAIDINALEDPTVSQILAHGSQFKLNCQYADELSVCIDQCKQNSNERNGYLYHENKPIICIIDSNTYKLGMATTLLQDEFHYLLGKMPFIITIDFKSKLKATLFDDKKLTISYIQSFADVVSQNTVIISDSHPLADIKLPHFATLPIILFVHCRLANQRIQYMINYVNYIALTLYFALLSYMIYNRCSSQNYFNDYMLVIYSLTMMIYMLGYVAMIQDFPFQIIREHAQAYDMIVKLKSSYLVEFAKLIFNSGFHGSCISILPLFIFYGSNDQNGYVHGVPLYQVMSICFLMEITTLRRFLDTLKVVFVQLVWAAIAITSGYITLYYTSDFLSNVFAQGFQTKELCSLIFVPFVILSFDVLSMYYKRLLSLNPLNKKLYEMDDKINDEYQELSLKEAKNYIKLHEKAEEESESPEHNSTMKHIA